MPYHLWSLHFQFQKIVYGKDMFEYFLYSYLGEILKYIT